MPFVRLPTFPAYIYIYSYRWLYNIGFASSHCCCQVPMFAYLFNVCLRYVFLSQNDSVLRVFSATLLSIVALKTSFEICVTLCACVNEQFQLAYFSHTL